MRVVNIKRHAYEDVKTTLTWSTIEQGKVLGRKLTARLTHGPTRFSKCPLPSLLMSSEPIFPAAGPSTSHLRPSLFELLADEQLRDLFHPVIKYVLSASESTPSPTEKLINSILRKDTLNI
jgi:hypothetical protein